ncbi:competence protein CoiA family protein [Paenibacillus roseipurpureus]|uniref:Competence protein CoiA family protein n=1 Tax=Paenibacillus roseopurpureus TaxID=2918901 RepID=A0AA96LRC8_9BACL|nr:competence protein CoiA family protein [Paenibacillus sp. MBLB1832]WNR45794.1 competence protein CoiA family protein [Paenibacillus sp. MBLB1832]
MDIAKYEGKQMNIISEISKYSDAMKESIIDKLRKIAEKGAMTCPFCDEKLILRAGDIRGVHFAHIRGKTCLESSAYDTYSNQVKRESQKHSVIKELIYDELKTQEKIKPDLKVEYGYKEKAKENWKYYPDIYLNKNGKEYAVSIVTNVYKIGDENVVKVIEKRNKYFTNKGLEIVWFIEDRELADDLSNRVIHLWEAERNLTVKTNADTQWDQFLLNLIMNYSAYDLFEVLNYHKRSSLSIDVRSLYYVHSVGEEITFSVYRLILDEAKAPFRAFAVNEGYKMNISKALLIQDAIQLSDHEHDSKDKELFRNKFISNLKDFELKRQQEEDKETKYVPYQDYINIQREQATEQIKNEVEYWVSNDFDVVEHKYKLERFTINSGEAKNLFFFLKRYRNDLNDYGFNVLMFKKLARQALGAISEAPTREWLVEIDEL